MTDQNLTELKERVLRDVLGMNEDSLPDERLDGVFWCSDDFLIIDGWQVVGGITRQWIKLLLPKAEFASLDSEINQRACLKYLENCSRGGVSADLNSYRWFRFLKDYWGMDVRDGDVVEYLEASRERLGKMKAFLCSGQQTLDGVGASEDTEEEKLVREEKFLVQVLSIDQLMETNPLCGEWGFSDEYDYCNECAKHIRTSPDSYGWKLNAWFCESDGYFCPECIDPDEYIEAVKNEVKDCNLNFVDPEERGWVRLEDQRGIHRFENGLHGGQDDDPTKQIALLNAHNIDALFTLYPSQFYMSWELWVPVGNEERVWEILRRGNAKTDIDPAVLCRQQLEGVSSHKREEGQSQFALGGEVVNIPQEWMARHPSFKVDPAYWVEFKRRHDALPQPVSEDAWFELAETLDAEMR